MLWGRLYITRGQKIPETTAKKHHLPKVATLKQSTVRIQWTSLQSKYIFPWPLSVGHTSSHGP